MHSGSVITPANPVPDGPTLAVFLFSGVISNPAIDMVLTGARSVEELDGSIDAVERGPLPPDLLARVEEIAAMVPFRPKRRSTPSRFRISFPPRPAASA